MPETQFQFKTVGNFTGGLDTSVPGDMLEDNKSPDLLNVFIDKGVLKVDTGYQTFGSTVTGYPQLCVQLFYKNGNSDLVLITTTRCYKWSNSEWQFVGGDTTTTLSSNASQNDTDIDVTDDSGFSDGDNICIKLDSGSQHCTTVDGAPAANTITLTDAMPSAATSGNAVIEPVVLDGNLENQVNFAQWVAGDILIITNNRDNVKQFDGDTLTDVSNLPSGGSCLAVNVYVFNNYLMLINTTEGGTQYPQRVRWCDTGDITDWSNGNASYEDLYDKEDYCLGVLSLGPYLYIYRERSIYRCSYVGATDLLFEFELMVSGEGVVSSQAVADVGDWHLFWGNSNLYRYDGDFSIRPMADHIYYKIFGTDGIASPSYIGKTFGLYIEELDEIWFLFPSTGQEYPDTLLRYSIVTDAIFIREFDHKFLGYGFYSTTNAKTWSDLSGSWLQQSWTWNSKRITSSSPITLLCGYDPKQVYQYDYTTNQDAGTDISWYFETKDFTTPSEKLRLDLLEFEAKGPTTKVLYSTDEGRNWTQIESKTMGTYYQKHRIWKQVVSDQFRIRFEGDSSGFAVKRLKAKIKEESFW